MVEVNIEKNEYGYYARALFSYNSSMYGGCVNVEIDCNSDTK